MSKFGIILCVVLFAAAANADLTRLFPKLSIHLITTKPNSETQKDKTYKKITEVEKTIKAAHKEFEEKAEILSSGTSNFSNEILNEIEDIQKKIINEINELYINIDDVDIFKCRDISRHQEVTNDVILKTNRCILDKLEPGFKDSDYIVEIYKNNSAEISKIRTEADNCKYISCFGDVRLKATITSIRVNRELKPRIKIFKGFVKRLETNLATCRTITNGIDNFEQMSSALVEKTKECIEQNIKNVSTVLP